MIGVSVFIFLGLYAEWSSGQFLNHRPYPTYSLEHMPDTEFSCRDKILGGYYADPETQCQMFHVCVKVSGIGVQDFRFLCPNGTAFDQDHQICADWQDVDCDATTLYYSSDNFDLYRIGSGFESKAVRYGEDEEPFSLQRAETGDVRLNREHQAQRVNQQKESFGYKPRPNEYQYQQQNANRNNYNNNNNKDDIFKGSSSSNFFNNRNGGKETDDDDYEPARVNANQDNDQTQKRKQIVRKTTRRPTYENQTEKPRSTGFANNFAGSSYIPTTTVRPVPTSNNEQFTRQRQRQRVNPQYNNAGNFRQTTNQNYEDDGRYRGDNYNNNNNGQFNRNAQTSQFTVSTPSPFRQSPENRTPQYNPTTTPPQPSRSTENYPSSFNQDQKYNEPQKTSNIRKENYNTSPVQTQPQTKTTDNYSIYRNNPTQTQAQTQTQSQTKATDNYPTYRNSPQGQYFNDQYETTKLKAYENYPTDYNAQNKKPTTPIKQIDNYPTTYSPKGNKDYKNVGFSDQFTTTASPPQNPTYTQTNQQDTTYNRPSSQYTLNLHHQQYDSSRTTNSQSPTYKETVQYSPVQQQQQQRQTTQYTQYTPTVPRITTPYYSSTTPGPRRSNRFDETQYDDGSYNHKFDNEDDKSSKDDEFLKTAHSINIASSRNEYLSNKNVPVSTTQKPRPFSVTPNSFKPTDYISTSNTQNTPTKVTANTNTQNTSRATTVNKPSSQSTPQKNTAPAKKVKDVSYDYAYYDTNVGSDHEYDIAAVDIEKDATKSKTK